MTSNRRPPRPATLPHAHPYYMHEGDGLGTYARPVVSADGRRAVTISITATTALVDQDKVNRAVETLTDHALCDDDTA